MNNTCTSFLERFSAGCVLLCLAVTGWSGDAPAREPVDAALAPIVRTLPDGRPLRIVKSYPRGLMRAYCVSFDDGNLEPDRKMAESLRSRGLHGTFFLNALHPQSQDAIKEGVNIYIGQEVASHGAHHKGFGKMTPEQVREELSLDQRILGERFGTVIDGFSYPYGDVLKDPAALEQAEKLMTELGIVYARTCKATRTFRPPLCFLDWGLDDGFGPSQAKLDRFLALPAEDSVRVLTEFTHSRDEVNKEKVWKEWLAYLDRIAREPIWCVSMRDFAHYVTALRRLEATDAGLRNPSTLPVWVRWNGTPVEFLPGQTRTWR
jgi:peptidoglycan-N-acetylglucosamine deacetylase